MAQFYSEIRLIHISAVIASGSLFFLRGFAIFLGAGWPKAKAVRFLTYTVDTVLLAAALMLTAIIGQYPFVDSWLTVKLVLLVVYIGLGIAAFHSGYKQQVRIGAWLAALAVFGFIVSVARAHNPLGILSGLGG